MRRFESSCKSSKTSFGVWGIIVLLKHKNVSKFQPSNPNCSLQHKVKWLKKIYPETNTAHVDWKLLEHHCHHTGKFVYYQQTEIWSQWRWLTEIGRQKPKSDGCGCKLLIGTINMLVQKPSRIIFKKVWLITLPWIKDTAGFVGTWNKLSLLIYRPLFLFYLFLQMCRQGKQAKTELCSCNVIFHQRSVWINQRPSWLHNQFLF